MKEEERAYIKEIVREVITELNHEKRIQEIERRVFNGFGLKINILYAICMAILAGIVKLAFF